MNFSTHPRGSTALWSRRSLLMAAVWPALVAAQKPPELLLAMDAGPGIDPSRYLVSEKYDGVRALWDGRQLRLRGGGAANAPAWFTARLPSQPLDGELWLARGRFDALSAIVRKDKPLDEDWRQVNYMLFELPDAPGPFSERAERLKALAARADWPPLQAVVQRRVADRTALRRLLDEVVSAGGEGLALHLADAPYRTGRGDALVKLKPVQDDDAVVIGYEPGKGKYAGQLGALTVRSPEGRVFHIGSGLSDAQRSSPPPLGSTVTYRYRGLTSQGLPRFASFLRLREAGL